MHLNPLQQDELATLEAEYRQALQRRLAAHLDALEAQRALEAAMRRAEAVLRRVGVKAGGHTESV
jgi:hypothetical protein